MHRTLAPALLLAACGGGLTQDDLDAALADLPTQADLDAATQDLASQDDLDDAFVDHLDAEEHGRTTDAAELVTGTLDVERLPIRSRTIPVDLFAVYHSDAITVGVGGFGNSGLYMPDSATSTFRFATVVPDDFVGTEMTLRILWRTSGTGCSMSLLPNSIDRSRVGYGPPGGSSASGLTGPLQALSAGSTANETGVAEYTISEGGGLPGLLPGDGLAISLFRHTPDTCTSDLQIAGISVVYDAR